MNKKRAFSENGRHLRVFGLTVISLLAAGVAQSASAGGFSVSNGQILDPNGNPFHAVGINMYTSQMSCCTNAILAAFPGMNMIRLATNPGGDNVQDIQNFVNQVTAMGIVVDVEDHHTDGNNYENVLTGQDLANEANWYANLAAANIGNPYVWFGTANEPVSLSNRESIAVQEQAIYNAIRGTGNNTIVLLELMGGGGFGFAQEHPEYFSSMRNVVWDEHHYGLLYNGTYSSDPAVINQDLQDQYDGLAKVPSADGLIPIIFGEYGISTDGSNTDANASQFLTAVQSSGRGNLAWAWNAGADSMTDGSGNLNWYGQEVAQYIATANQNPNPLPTPTPSPTNPPSTGQVVLTPSSGGSITDGAGNVWTLTPAGDVMENGNAVPNGSGTGALTYVTATRTIWGQDAATGSWYSWDGSNWNGPASTPPIAK